MAKFRIGRHINLVQGFIEVPAYAHRHNSQIFQIFLGSPERIISKARTKEELIKFGKELQKYKLKMVIHGSYTINLAHPRTSRLFISSVRSLVQDLNASEIIGKRCLGVIIHMGKNVVTNRLTEDKALDNYVYGLKMALSQTSPRTTIILETGASQGREVGSKIEGLSKIYWNLEAEERERIKFCVDLCHIWATGYDISSPEKVNAFFQKFDELIGIKRIAVIHFNDSRTKLASKVDRHADIGYGFINLLGLEAAAQFAQKHEIPIILETPLDSVNPKTNKDVTFQEELSLLKLWTK